jgi:hypothetical protein
LLAADGARRVGDVSVVWRGSDQPYRANVWDLSSLCLTFERRRFERALTAVAAC